MPRLTLNDTLLQIFTKMSDGNPGALSVLARLFKEEAKIDPDSFIGGLGTILAMDEMGIYGSHIWILYKDICEQNLIKLIALFRAHQLGFISGSVIIDSAKDFQAPKINVDELLDKVIETLPKFGNFGDLKNTPV